MAPGIVKHFNLKLSVWILSCEVTYPLPRHFSRWFFVFPRWDMLVPWMVCVGTSSCHRSWWLRPFPVPPDSSQGFWGSQALGRHDDKTKNQNQPEPKTRKRTTKKMILKKGTIFKQHWKPKSPSAKGPWMKESLNFILIIFLLHMHIPQKLSQVGHWLSEKDGQIATPKTFGISSAPDAIVQARHPTFAQRP